MEQFPFSRITIVEIVADLFSQDVVLSEALTLVLVYDFVLWNIEYILISLFPFIGGNVT